MNGFKSNNVPHALPLTGADDAYCQAQTTLYIRGEYGGAGRVNSTRFVNLVELDHHSAATSFHHHDDAAVNLSRSSMYNEMKASNVSVVSSNLQFGGPSNSIGSAEFVSPGAGGVDPSGHFLLPRSSTMINVGGANGSFENGGNWADSGVAADHSQQTDDTSTDTDEKNHYRGGGINQGRLIINVDSIDQGKTGDQKIMRRLAQNREAARKSRMRKKAYVEQLESSRQKLAQLEQDLKRARQQGIFVSSSNLSGDPTRNGNGALAFDLEYGRWFEGHQRLIGDLRAAVNSHAGDSELRLLVEAVMSHYDEIFRLKSVGVKSHAFHMLSGMWKTPVERCFMWLGGFRSSDILKILGNQIEPLTDQQVVGICSLQQSSQQAEDALSQGMEALQQTLVETLSSSSRGVSGNVADYMGHMAVAMSKLSTLENFLHQADLLRQQTLQRLQQILTTRQAARALLAISDYKCRLRALSSLWLARPKLEVFN